MSRVCCLNLVATEVHYNSLLAAAQACEVSLPGDVCEHEVDLAWELRVGNVNGISLCQDCEVAG